MVRPTTIAAFVIAAIAVFVLSLAVSTSPLRSYVLLKGAEGFGDRLQCLLHAIRYARRSNRRLVVDWRDEHWCHDGRSGFDEYFEIIGVRAAGVDELAHALDYESTLSPTRWTRDAAIQRTPVADLYRYDAFVDEHSTATCVVHPGVRHRVWHCADAVHLRARPWLAERVRRAFDGVVGPYTAVHLRGGDRLARSVAEGATTREAYVAGLRARALAGGDGPVILVSDDAGLIAEYARQCAAAGSRAPRASGRAPPAACVDRDAGTHLTPAHGLPCAGVDKRALNADAVCDFVVLSHADRVVADGASLFSQMARCVPYPAFGIRAR
jgi:hypothetical protein